MSTTINVTCPVCQADGTATLCYSRPDQDCGWSGGWELDVWVFDCPCFDSGLVDSGRYEERVMEQAVQNAQDADEAARDAAADARLDDYRDRQLEGTR